MPSRKLSFQSRTISVPVLLFIICCLFISACQLISINQIISAKENDKTRNTARHPMKTTINKRVNFYEALKESLKERGSEINSLYEAEDAVLRRLLEEYGAVFIAHEAIIPPPVCMFTNAEDVADFQAKADIGAAEINGVKIELQKPALAELLSARAEAQKEGLDITPRDGSEAARRNYDDTVRLWNSRFLPALKHWQNLNRILPEEVEKLTQLPLREQVAAVLEMEERGIFFSKDFSKSILYSVAAPGASQHLSLLAFDANEFADKQVRKILARHGWFRTVRNDLPHFTFLGLKGDELSSRGLKKLETKYGEFWVPNV